MPNSGLTIVPTLEINLVWKDCFPLWFVCEVDFDFDFFFFLPSDCGGGAASTNSSSISLYTLIIREPQKNDLALLRIFQKSISQPRISCHVYLIRDNKKYILLFVYCSKQKQ